MAEYFRILKLLLWKNLIVHKKHWKKMLFFEIMIPLLLFICGQAVRSSSSPDIIQNNTYHESDDPEVLINFLSIRHTPKNNMTDEIMKRMSDCMTSKSNIRTESIGASSEQQMLAEFLGDRSKDALTNCMGIIFETMEDSTLPKNFHYRILSTSMLPNKLYDEEENGDGAKMYFLNSPIVQIQMCLDKAYIAEAANLSLDAIKISTQQMPYPPYIPIGMDIKIMLEVLVVLATLAFFIIGLNEVTFPSNEKYIGINILMSMNGVKNHQNLLSWLLSGALFSPSYLVPIVIILKYFRPSTVVPFIEYSNSFIIWIVLTVYVCHVIAFSIHITAYLWKPFHGSTALIVVTILMNIVEQYAAGTNLRRFLIYLGILSPNLLLRRVLGEIDSYETDLVGIQWSNLFSTGDPTAPGESCIGVLVLFSLLGILANFFITVYVYAVLPGKYGVAENPLFFLQKRKKNYQRVDLTPMNYDNRTNEREFEKVPEGALSPGIQIRKLKKSFATSWLRGTRVQALCGIDVDFYQGQITALLGHNGAGKTTMMSIISGLVSSSEGTIFINGQNVQHELDAVRRNLGLCPQENMVFPDLSVREQVLFFGMLKAKDKTRSQLVEEVEILLSKVNLSDKRNSLASELSGGQKRRMCLAMTLVGDAKVLILDEPTSGLDAENKREVWDIILKLRGEKTILISTHDMEEADILGDRVAIIHSGRMRCYGTSMFLKKLYGDGQVELTLSIEPNCDPRRIIEAIDLDAQLLSQDEGQAVLAIPLAENLPEALDALEREKRNLGVTGLSVSIISLEQVFLRVTREKSDENDSTEQAAKLFDRITGLAYFRQTSYAFFAKKLSFASKNPWTTVISIILPCLAALALILVNGGSSINRRPMSLGLDAYSHARAFVYSENSIYGEKYATSARAYGATSEYIGANHTLNEALLQVANDDLSTYRKKFIVSGEFNRTSNGTLHANGFYSGTAYLGIPATINMLTNAIVKETMKNDDYTIRIFAQRMPDSFDPNNKKSMVASITITIALVAFLAPAVALYVAQSLQENLTSVKHLQLMTGASSLSYWGTMYIFDLLQYVVSIVLLIGAFVIVDATFATRFYHTTEIAIFFVILFFFGASVFPLVYLLSFSKLSMNACTKLLMIIPLFLSLINYGMIALRESVTSKIYNFFFDILSQIFLLIPHVNVINGHAKFFDDVSNNSRCRRMTDTLLEAVCKRIPHDPCCAMECHNGSCDKPQSYFSENPFYRNLDESLLRMTGSTILFFAMIFVLEQKFLPKLFARFQKRDLGETFPLMDELVRKEASLVATEITKFTMKQKNQPLIGSDNIYHVHELSKNYGNLRVVRGISFRVRQFECFGLLGVNGAGKSTTFRMLTGEEMPRGGSMYLKEYNLRTDRTKYLSEMGYCPQHDAIIETLNARDHLYLFARLRGIPSNEIKAAVEKWIHKLNLTVCAAQPSGTYSGGNKRRLNIAMALIGNPSLVLMDEPTTGVDPAARRSLWNTLKTCQEAGQSIILTSHSMEECEVLCNRLVIMVKGQLVCVGASQELKQRFGAGYNIHVKLNPGSQRNDLERIKRRIETTLVCKLIDENMGFIGYHVTDPHATWTIMYRMMGELKNEYPCIEDFAVLSSTLEQLFIQFARASSDDDEADRPEGTTKRRWWQKKRHGSVV